MCRAMSCTRLIGNSSPATVSAGMASALRPRCAIGSSASVVLPTPLAPGPPAPKTQRCAAAPCAAQRHSAPTIIAVCPAAQLARNAALRAPSSEYDASSRVVHAPRANARARTRTSTRARSASAPEKHETSSATAKTRASTRSSSTAIASSAASRPSCLPVDAIASAMRSPSWRNAPSGETVRAKLTAPVHTPFALKSRHDASASMPSCASPSFVSQ